jgi:hypothetical protein
MAVQEVRWEGSGTHQHENTHLSVEKRIRTMNWVQAFFYIRESLIEYC